ncbi:hypothetical protein BH11GEM2_BH11GEM2_36540 [soil metagenome]
MTAAGDFIDLLAERLPQAKDINDQGTVVGFSDNRTGTGNAVIWRGVNGVTATSGESLGLRTDDATAVSEQGEVVGLGADGPFLWKDSRFVILRDAIAETGLTFAREAPRVSANGVIALKGQRGSAPAGVVVFRRR